MSFTSRRNGVIACGFKTVNQTLQEKKIYTVIDGFSFTPLGVFDDFDQAKKSGEKITDDKFIILHFVLNSECDYHFNNIYQSPGLIPKDILYVSETSSQYGKDLNDDSKSVIDLEIDPNDSKSIIDLDDSRSVIDLTD
jgi:hypothetical protein